MPRGVEQELARSLVIGTRQRRTLERERRQREADGAVPLEERAERVVDARELQLRRRRLDVERGAALRGGLRRTRGQVDALAREESGEQGGVGRGIQSRVESEPRASQASPPKLEPTPLPRAPPPPPLSGTLLSGDTAGGGRLVAETESECVIPS